MKIWEQFSSIEKSLWIARNVMGWPRNPYEPFMAILGFGQPIEEGFFPQWDAGHDYLVLKCIRERWNHEQNQAFVTHLGTIRWPRCNVSQPFSLELYAEPGDYSHAAYLTLCEKPQDQMTDE